jgi:hypothetical protein
MLEAAKLISSLTVLNYHAIFEDVFRQAAAMNEAQASQASTNRRFVASSRRLARLNLSVETTRVHQGQLCAAFSAGRGRGFSLSL